MKKKSASLLCLLPGRRWRQNSRNSFRRRRRWGAHRARFLILKGRIGKVKDLNFSGESDNLILPDPDKPLGGFPPAPLEFKAEVYVRHSLN